MNRDVQKWTLTYSISARKEGYLLRRKGVRLSSKRVKLLKAFALKKVLDDIDKNTPFFGVSGIVEVIKKTEDCTIRMMIRLNLGTKEPALFENFFEDFAERNREFIGLIVA